MLPAVAAELAGLPFANPASPHREGQEARRCLDQARDRAAGALGVAPAELVFCASGSEAVNLALAGTMARRPGRLVTWAAEHQAVLGVARDLELAGHAVTVLDVDEAARADPGGLPEDAAVVSIGLANNEVGTLQPVAAIAARAHSLGALVHLDACQGPPWLAPPLELCDLASFSGHKLGAGRGGLLWVRGGVRVHPLVFGGPQEWGKRAGREDLAAALALGVALEQCAARRQVEASRVRPLRDRLQPVLEELGGRASGGEPRLPSLASVTLAPRRGEDMVLALDLAGLATSSGSACASGSLDPSHVLLAMGRSLPEALGSLRLSLSYATSQADVDQAVTVLRRVLGT